MTAPGRAPEALIVDNGSRSAALIARLLDEAGWSATTVPVQRLWAALSGGDAVILTGTDAPVGDAVYETELELIRSWPVPILGICGGMQLIGRAYGAELGRVPTAIGRTTVRLIGDSRLHAGMPSEVQLFERHIYGLRGVPDELVLTAESDDCPVEGIRHRHRPAYGMQAHLEFRADGRRLLRAFLDLARPFAPAPRQVDA